jgi:hypothetical protein
MEFTVRTARRLRRREGPLRRQYGDHRPVPPPRRPVEQASGDEQSAAPQEQRSARAENLDEHPKYSCQFRYSNVGLLEAIPARDRGRGSCWRAVVSPTQVTLSLGGRTVSKRTMRPSYHPVYPNGPDCAAACQQAQEPWDVP